MERVTGVEVATEAAIYRKAQGSNMPTDTLTEAEFEVARFLASSPSAEEIVAFHFSPQSAERFYALIEAERANQLSDDERAQLDAFTSAEHFMRLIKAEARKRLTQTVG